MAAYQQAHSAPCLLAYPSQGGTVSDSCTIVNGHPLHLVELPTTDTYPSYDAFRDAVTDAMHAAIGTTMETTADR